MPYICTKFHEEILNGFKVIERIQPHCMKETKGHNYIKTESRVMVIFFCILSDLALHLYKVSLRNVQQF